MWSDTKKIGCLTTTDSQKTNYLKTNLLKQIKISYCLCYTSLNDVYYFYISLFIYHKVSVFCAYCQEFIKVFIGDLSINNNYL